MEGESLPFIYGGLVLQSHKYNSYAWAESQNVKKYKAVIHN